MKHWMPVLLLCAMFGCGKDATHSRLSVHTDGIPLLSTALRDHYVGELQAAAFSNGVWDLQQFKTFVGAHPDRDVMYYWNGTAYPPATLAQLFCLYVSGDLPANQSAELLAWASSFILQHAPTNTIQP